MRIVQTAYLTSGAVLGKPIVDIKGRTLLHKGVQITDWQIKRLQKYNIPYVYIDDIETSHIIPEDIISDKIRRGAIVTIKDTFDNMKSEVKQSKSIVIENAALTMSKLVDQLTAELKGHQDLFHIISDIYTFDSYVFNHSLNVALYSLAIGLELKLKPDVLRTLGLGSILHDVGKMAVPEEILFKPGKLLESEFQIIKRHSEEGFHILRQVHNLSLLVAHCAYQHHERLDGSGYPRGLKNNEILYMAKIIAVADVFDAVTSKRVYREAMLPSEALELLYAGTGTKFDREIVDAFKRSIAIYPIGITVELNDGRKGIVSRQNAGYSDRPVIEVYERNGEQLPFRYEVDLKIQLDVTIKKCDTTFSNHTMKLS
jgi:putative nucleotidyltransferase with HDIG domain